MTSKTLENLLISSAICCGGLLLGSCGESDSDDEVAATDPSTPGVVVSDSDTVSLSGKLAIGSGLRLAADGSGLLAVNMSGGTPIGDPADIEVAADGSFSYSASKINDQVDEINAELAKDESEWDWDTLAVLASDLFGESLTGEELQSYGADDVRTYMEQFASQLETLGTTTLLIAYDPSDDVTAEAESFRFIGLPTSSGKNLIALANQSMVGNLSLGDISDGDDGESTAELEAETGFDLSESVIDTLAESGKALKDFKNRYMNDDWSIETFWAWRGEKADAIDQYNTPSELSYSGVGFYIGSQTDTPFVYDELCSTKLGSLVFTPPSSVQVKAGDDSISTYTTFSNADATQSTQGDNRICSGGSFYGREDGTNDFMINFGTGGGIQGDLPSGLWRMTWDGTEVARFDVALTKPFDSDGNPTVFIPSAKFVTSNSQINSVTIKFYIWNGTELSELTDITAFQRLVSQVNASITKEDTNGEVRGTATFADGATEATLTFDEAVATSNAAYMSVSYTIGTANYRTEYR
ncbi:hypothetical protein [Pseudobacteriovorax antillogorgiicola]|uniref:Uncharacterized protein n=1 Tax=Pseudobacteriovorax antillogorgiicola TaxID=1513793 RepID=A0A1Y6BKK9_9BACT|nr:hypothetical protein [Pseudobacteriovorax antillogorgiicola]TCS56221.1 hypothetical protein EDD56_10443 [Pseudobacteriovorax antillogorgiicola]SMF08378.1 hypothetical protein SAMN06296036_104291 [Pseudobacteriovorax antillogorgiicola]